MKIFFWLCLCLFQENKNTRRECSNYERPWQFHPKKPKKSKSDLAVSTLSPPSPESQPCECFSNRVSTEETTEVIVMNNFTLDKNHYSFAKR